MPRRNAAQQLISRNVRSQGAGLGRLPGGITTTVGVRNNGKSMPDQTHEQKIAALLEQETAVRLWLEQKRGLEKDRQGRTLIRGLTIEETEEFLRLSRIVQSHETGLIRADQKAKSERYAELKDKLESALQEETIESLSSWG
jgi:hypothetical protein